MGEFPSDLALRNRRVNGLDRAVLPPISHVGARARWTGSAWNAIVIDGHDWNACFVAFRRAQATRRTICHPAGTLKGKGFSFIDNAPTVTQALKSTDGPALRELGPAVPDLWSAIEFTPQPLRAQRSSRSVRPAIPSVTNRTRERSELPGPTRRADSRVVALDGDVRIDLQRQFEATHPEPSIISSSRSRS